MATSGLTIISRLFAAANRSRKRIEGMVAALVQIGIVRGTGLWARNAMELSETGLRFLIGSVAAELRSFGVGVGSCHHVMGIQ